MANAKEQKKSEQHSVESITEKLYDVFATMGCGLVLTQQTDALLTNSLVCHAKSDSCVSEWYTLSSDAPFVPKEFPFNDKKHAKLAGLSAEDRKAYVVNIQVNEKKASEDEKKNALRFEIFIEAFRIKSNAEGLSKLTEHFTAFIATEKKKNSDVLDKACKAFNFMRKKAFDAMRDIAKIPILAEHEKAPDSYSPLDHSRGKHEEPELEAYQTFRKLWRVDALNIIGTAGDLHRRCKKWEAGWMYLVEQVLVPAFSFGEKHNIAVAFSRAAAWPLQWKSRLYATKTIDYVNAPIKTVKEMEDFFLEFVPAPCNKKKKLNVLVLRVDSGEVHVSFHSGA
jgi:hypothetical protein